MYSKEIEKILKRKRIKITDRVKVKKGKTEYEGLLMPRSEIGDNTSIILKLDSGYDIGIKYGSGVKIEKSKTREPKNILKEEKFELGKVHFKKKKLRYNPKKPTISILHTGGTIASKVDYKTGGVVSFFSPEDIVSMFPEISKIANIRSKLVFQMFSEDMEPEHWSILTREISKEIKSGVDGIIITHGTDTMQYTSAALSFMLQDLPIPVILVGSQRSSDRGSSDAGMNLISATTFIANTDFSGVAICMHGTTHDDYCLIHPGSKVKKMHTSRRDTFRTINTLPWARVDYKTKEIKFLRKDYPKKDKKRKLKLMNKIEKKVAIVKIRPGFNYKELEIYEKLKYKGLIIEGTGLGNAPVNVLDKYTKKHANFLKTIEKMCKKGIIIVMTSQCVYGKVNMNVYSSARYLQKAGVIPGEDMLTETAYVKLMWLLGNYPKEKVKELISQNLRGEITDRITNKTFLY